MRVRTLALTFLAFLLVVMDGQADFVPWQLYASPSTPALGQHAICKHIDADSVPIDQTSSFSICDDKVVSWQLPRRDKRMHSVEWIWYSPGERNKGRVYARTFGIIPPDDGPMGIWSAPIWSSLQIAGKDASNLPGSWKVDVIVDYKKVLTESFTLDLVCCWGDFDCDTSQVCCDGTCYKGECCSNTDCTDLNNPICDVITHTCECDSISCEEGHLCCDGTCCVGECCSNSDCTDLTNPICDVITHTCECDSTSCGRDQVCCGGTCCAGECCSNTDCTDLASPICNVMTHTCECDSTSCGRDQVCCDGTCCAGECCSNTDCADEKICCNNRCVDVTKDIKNCGACGNACYASEVCAEASCVCDTTHYNCDGIKANGCEETEVCLAGDYCIADSGCANSCCIEFSNECADLLTDEGNCGACANVCGTNEICTKGSCECDKGFSDCNGLCVDLMADEGNCGACATDCSTNEVCTKGSCECDKGLSDCNGLCIDLLTDESNCGTCGCACTGAKNTCCGGLCVDLMADESNCGSCGTTCLEGKTCEKITKLIKSLAGQDDNGTHKIINFIP